MYSHSLPPPHAERVLSWPERKDQESVFPGRFPLQNNSLHWRWSGITRLPLLLLLLLLLPPFTLTLTTTNRRMKVNTNIIYPLYITYTQWGKINILKVLLCIYYNDEWCKTTDFFYCVIDTSLTGSSPRSWGVPMRSRRSNPWRCITRSAPPPIPPLSSSTSIL